MILNISCRCTGHFSQYCVTIFPYRFSKSILSHIEAHASICNNLQITLNNMHRLESVNCNDDNTSALCLCSWRSTRPRPFWTTTRSGTSPTQRRRTRSKRTATASRRVKMTMRTTTERVRTRSALPSLLPLPSHGLGHTFTADPAQARKQSVRSREATNTHRVTGDSFYTQSPPPFNLCKVMDCDLNPDIPKFSFLQRLVYSLSAAGGREFCEY